MTCISAFSSACFLCISFSLSTYVPPFSSFEIEEPISVGSVVFDCEVGQHLPMPTSRSEACWAGAITVSGEIGFIWIKIVIEFGNSKNEWG